MESDAVPETLPEWYDPKVALTRIMLPDLRLLCCIQREPHRGEHCPGIWAAREREMTRHERPPELWTNIDFMLDFVMVGAGLGDRFRYALGSLARCCMPGFADPPDWHYNVTRAYIRRLPMDWSKLAARREQYRAWRGPALQCAARCGADEKTVLEVLAVICFATEVADAELDFGRLASAVAFHSCESVRREQGYVDPWELARV